MDEMLLTTALRPWLESVAAPRLSEGTESATAFRGVSMADVSNAFAALRQPGFTESGSDQKCHAIDPHWASQDNAAEPVAQL